MVVLGQNSKIIAGKVVLEAHTTARPWMFRPDEGISYRIRREGLIR